MKITLDTKTGICKVGGKDFNSNEIKEFNKNVAVEYLRNFLIKNTKLSEYELDSMWMSYRYCIGRHTISSHYRAADIAKHCYGRLSDERSIFNAYDINKEIEDKLRFGCGVEFHFPITSLNKIYTSAVDIWCQFIEDYGISSKEEYLKYKTVDVILSDNERGYKLETTTWDEWIEDKRGNIIKKHNLNPDITDEELSVYDKYEDIAYYLNTLKHRTNEDYFFLMNIEDLFIWNDLVHLFDKEHHHKSVLVDGTECEWFWTYTQGSEKHDDGYYYRKDFKYERIRVPVDKWTGYTTTWIPDDKIKKDLY